MASAAAERLPTGHAVRRCRCSFLDWLRCLDRGVRTRCAGAEDASYILASDGFIAIGSADFAEHFDSLDLNFSTTNR